MREPYLLVLQSNYELFIMISKKERCISLSTWMHRIYSHNLVDPLLRQLHLLAGEICTVQLKLEAGAPARR